MRTPGRARVATGVLRSTAAISRRLGLGSGSTVGGRLGLLVDPELLAHLGGDRRVALVSGTNGKTTTTALLAAAVGRLGEVATSVAGANMPAGLATALADAPDAPFAVLEIDEGHLPAAVRALDPEVVVLLNLSRDQLDRMSEVRMLAERWRRALEGSAAKLVANGDDPLVVWAASGAPRVAYVGAGGAWHEDAYHCPNCDARIAFGADGWACTCGFRRPELAGALEGETLVLADGSRHQLPAALPGRFNRANVALATLAAAALGVDPPAALGEIAGVHEVAGRFARHGVAGRGGELMLAKNPAGWTELVELVAVGDRPVVVGINARVADGHDPSWLWDVPFERLTGHPVVATGERRRDLAVRLRHAGLERAVADDPVTAIAASPGGAVDYVGNYTAFQDTRQELRRRRPPAAATLAFSPADPVVPATMLAGSPATGAPAETLPKDPVVATPGRAGGTGPAARPRREVPRRRDSVLSVVLVHPDLLGTYGDGGNARILANRAAWRGVEVELVLAPSDVALPKTGDLYCLGGGEDGPQTRAAKKLAADGFASVVEAGAGVLAICAGYQILGERFPGADGRDVAGLGILDVTTTRGQRRAVGELALTLGPRIATGFENHAGRSTRGERVEPFATVLAGVGNGDGTDGARRAGVLATYAHGPVLARNAWLADELLAIALGGVLPPIEDEEEAELFAERLAVAVPKRRVRTRRRSAAPGGGR